MGKVSRVLSFAEGPALNMLALWQQQQLRFVDNALLQIDRYPDDDGVQFSREDCGGI